MAELHFNTITLSPPTPKRGDGPVPKLTITPPSLQLPGWAKWLIKVLLKKFLPTIMSWIGAQLPEVVKWVWKMADRIAFNNLPDEVPSEVMHTVQAWLKSGEKEIMKQL